MVAFLKKRKLRKRLKEALHAARHARFMREDIADPRDVETLRAAEKIVQKIRRTGKGDAEKPLIKLGDAVKQVYPVYKSFVMETTETLIVVLGTVIAIWAFFIQPFKIPTGSMQPTLNGITVEAQNRPGFFDNPITKFPKWLLTGTSYKEFRTTVSGRTGNRLYSAHNKIVLDIGGVPHEFPEYLRSELVRMYEAGKIKPFYRQGEVIAAVKVTAGDHIMVNKMKYNFMRPQRGDVTVFDTRSLEGIRQDVFYIKRIVGLPGEKMQIRSGRIVADGQIVSDPPVFKKIANDPAYNGGHGHEGRLYDAEQYVQLDKDAYLMCGDNTAHGMSLDGRFFGGVPQRDLKGAAVFVYWPLREHWGPIR